MADQQEQETPKRIEVVGVEALALDPEKKYLILLDNTVLGHPEALELKAALEELGVEHSVAFIAPDPTHSVQIVEL